MNDQEKKTIKISPVEYALFCDYASLSVDGKMNLNGIFDRIVTDKFPVTHPQMFVVSKLILPQGEHKIGFTLMQEDKVLAKSTVDKKMEAQLGSHTHFWGIKNLEIDEGAPIELQILIGGKQVYVRRLPVRKVERKES